MGDDLEIKLPLRYVIPELVRQQGVAKAGHPVWAASDWTEVVDKRHGAGMLEETKKLRDVVKKMDLERLRDLEEGPTRAMKRWEQEARKELEDYYARQSASGGSEHTPGVEETPSGE